MNKHITEPYSPGFCITWDNVGKMVKTCHQSTGRQNKMMLWALAYAAENRVSTTHFSNTALDAAEIPNQKFLPMADMEVIVARIIKQEMPYFNNCNVPQHIRHKFWREASKKSKIVSLIFKQIHVNNSRKSFIPDNRAND